MATRTKNYVRPRTRYRVRNWHTYNQALKQRGSLNVWISNEVLAAWYAVPDGSPGCPRHYSEQAIETVLTIRKLFRLPYRQTEGFMRSFLERLNLTLGVPDYSTLCRRGRFLVSTIPKKDKENVDIVIDSTGVKVYGAGEWNTKRHGKKKAKRWKKIHVGIDADGEIRVGEVTDESTDDAAVASALLDQETARITSITADGAYDKRKVYTACHDHGVQHVIIPPRSDAKIWQHGNRNALPHPRDENLRAIRRGGRARWKEDSGYHRRSLVESTMFRLKTILGDRVLAREDSRQRTEMKIGFSILNRMLQLGMPDSYAVTS